MARWAMAMIRSAGGGPMSRLTANATALSFQSVTTSARVAIVPRHSTDETTRSCFAFMIASLHVDFVLVLLLVYAPAIAETFRSRGGPVLAICRRRVPDCDECN